MRLCLLVCLLALPGPALAQEVGQDNDPEATTVDEIVVTGTREQGYRATVAPQINRTDTPLQELPFSVQVVTRELIEDRGIVTAGEALRYVPGFSPQVGFGAVNERFNLRGFQVAYSLRNGLRRDAFIGVERLNAVEQIEVLKGPASALYGRFEPGGVVNFVTKRPTASPFTEIVASVGDFGYRGLTLDTSTPLSDTVGVRLNASVDHRGSFRDFGFIDDWSVSPVLVWRPSERTTVTLEAEYGAREGYFDRGFGNNPLFLSAPRERQFGEPDARLDNRGGQVAAFLDHEFSDVWSARAAVSFSRFEQDSFYYGYAFPPVSGATGPDPIVRRRPTRAFDQYETAVGQFEAYGRFTTGDFAHKLLVGLELDSEDAGPFTSEGAPALPISFNNPVYGSRPGVFTPNFAGSSNVDGLGIYVQDEIARGPFRLLAGVRIDEVKSSSFNALNGSTQNRKDSAASPRVGLTWTLAPEVSIYASYGRSFRPQVGVGLLRGGGLPEALEGKAVEVGAKLNLLDGRVRPTLSVFEIERRNVAVSDPMDFNFVQQIGESRSRGVEIEVAAAPSRQLRLIANYTYLDADVTNDSSLAPGTPLVNVPEHSASVFASYDLSGALTGLSVGVGAQYIGERAGNSFATIILPEYTRVDANVAYTFDTRAGEVRAQLNLLNVTDEAYFDNGGAFLPLYPGAPRTLSASIGLTF